MITRIQLAQNVQKSVRIINEQWARNIFDKLNKSKACKNSTALSKMPINVMNTPDEVLLKDFLLIIITEKTLPMIPSTDKISCG